MLDAIAAERARGRILLVGTTNRDSRRRVIWNLIEIAASGRPEALELFQKLLIASAAIPGTFPPEMIDVEADHESYQGLHGSAAGSLSRVSRGAWPPVAPSNEHAREGA